MIINNHIGYYCVFIVSVFLLNLYYITTPISAQTVTFINDQSLALTGYPRSTSSNGCDIDTPLLITSAIPITGVDAEYPFNLIVTYKAPDGSEYIATFVSSDTAPIIGLSFSLYFTVYLSTGANTQLEYFYDCHDYDTSKLNHTVLSSGIYYNTLSIIVQFNQYLARPNVTLDIDVPVPYTQNYIGNNIYSISLHYNTPSVLFDLDYSLPIKFKNEYNYIITINKPFIYSNILPTIKYYSSSSSIIKDTVYYELSGFNNNNNNNQYNHYFSALKDKSKNYYQEPYLISSDKYLSALSSPEYELTVTDYSLSYYYSNTKRVLFNQIVNQSPKGLSIPLLAGLAKEYLNWVDVNFTRFSNYEYPVVFRIGDLSPELRYPFGIRGGNTNNGIDMAVTVSIYSERVTQYSINYYINNVPYAVLVSKNYNYSYTPAVVQSYGIELIPGGNIRLNINFPIAPTYVVFYSGIDTVHKVFNRFEVTTTGLPTQDVFDIILPRFNIYKIRLITYGYTVSEYIFGSDYSYRMSGILNSFSLVQDLDVLPINFDYSTGLKNVSFLFNDLVVTNRGVSNKMYITLENYPISREVKATFIYSDYRVNEKKDIAYSTFNPTTNQFEFEFNIPKNIKTGNVSYTITLDSLDNVNYYSYSLPSEYQLRISESNNIDLFGPVVANVLVSNLKEFKIGYTFEISDAANGFKFGYILVRGSLDLSERNITITPSNLYAGTLLKGAYYVEFNYDSPCVSQQYSIVYAYFEDTEGYSTEYDAIKINNRNPFYLILDSFNPLITSICNAPLPTNNGHQINPDIVSFSNPTLSALLQTKESRTYTLNYTAYHPDGISTTYLPKVYLACHLASYFTSHSTSIISSNSTHTSFSSSGVIPYALGVYTVSIYGILSKAGTNGGFTGSDLESRNFNYEINPSLNSLIPGFTGSSKLSSTGLGGLWLFGLYLNRPNSSKDFQIQYTDEENGGVYNTIIPKIIYSTAIYFNPIRPTTKPINIRIYNGVLTSDPYTIYPVVYDFNYSNNNNSNNSSSLCKGTPLCGGPSQGTCISTGCKCILPWTGDDCMSRIIQIEPPTVNETNPSTNITTGEHATINSIVSIIGIKELSINSNEVNRYYFEEWAYNLVINDSYITRYTYSSFIKKDDIKVSNITVTLDWYKLESTIEFANQSLNINPSSIKYTIKISNYPFSSQLNTLQLIMKASIQTSNSESCSDKQISESNDADYFKLQVDEFSFYCRFIKRCQIDDDRVTTLTNTILDSKMNDTIINDSNQISQSYIGINIPFFNDNVVIDPDFSIILDSNAAKSNCKGDSGLTTTQLAGIIVGSVCFFIVLLIIISLIIYKKPGACIPFKMFIYKFKKQKPSI